MRLRALVATSLLTTLLLMAPTGLAEEEPPATIAPLQPLLENAEDGMERTLDQAEEAVTEFENGQQPEEEAERSDASEDPERNAHPDEEETTQQVLEDVAAVDESVETLLTELQLLDLDGEDAEENNDDEANFSPDDDSTAPLTTADVAPRHMDLVTSTVLAAAAVGTMAVASKSGVIRFLSGAALGLFSRFQGPQVLENPRRAELNNLVCKNPGITVPDLCTESGLSRNAVLHHLRMLEDQGMIVHRRMGRSTHWFENGGRYGRERKDAYAVLHDRRTRDVAQFILHHPGSHQGAIGTALGLSPSVVHWHMKRLEDAALVQRERSGRSMLCYPGGPLSDLSL